MDILVRTRDDTGPGLRSAEKNTSASAAKIGSIMGNLGQNLTKGGGILAAGSGLLAMSAPIAAAGIAVGGFGAVAGPVLAKVLQANTKMKAAQLEYNNAVTDKQRQTALLHEQQATAGLSTTQKTLLGDVNKLGAAFQGVQKALEPIISKVVDVGTKIGIAFMPALEKLAKAGGQILLQLLNPLLNLVKSPLFAQFTDTLAKVGVAAGKIISPLIISLLREFMRLIIGLAPAGLSLLKVLSPLFEGTIKAAVPIIIGFANGLAKVVEWVSKWGLLPKLILAVAAALAILVTSSGIGAVIIGVALLMVALKKLADYFHINISGAAKEAGEWLKKVWESKGMQEFLGNLKTIVTQVAKFALAVFDALNKSGLFKDMLQQVKNVFKLVGDAVKLVADLLTGKWSKLPGDAAKIFGDLGRIVLGALKILRDQAVAIWNLLGHDIRVVWNNIWTQTIGRLTQGYNDTMRVWGTFRHDTSAWFAHIRDDLKLVWDTIWNNTIGRVERGYRDVVNWVGYLRRDVSSAVTKLRDDLAHLWDVVWNNTVGRVQRGYRDVLNWAGYLRRDVAGAAGKLRDDLAGIWNVIWNNTGARVQRGYKDVLNWVGYLRRDVSNAVTKLRDDLGHVWDIIWNNTIGRVQRGYKDVVNWFNGLRSSVATTITNTKNDLARLWDTIWNNTIGRVKNGINDVVNWCKGIPGRVVSAIGDLTRTLTSHGGDLIRGLLNGITSALAGIGNWVKNNIFNPIVNAVKHFFGISSPSTVFAELGGHLMSGFIKGLITSGKNVPSLISKVFGGMPKALLGMMEKGVGGITALPAKAVNALKGLGSKAAGVLKSIGGFAGSIWDSLFGGGGSPGKVTAGVEQWRGLVQQALSMLGMSPGLAGRILYQMGTESGGNQASQNNWDSNAQRGTPSKGLMQVIDPTFRAYHVPGTSNNIWDPLANIASAINYARHAYGPTLGALGSGHGYATGGIGSGWAIVGEHGRELVRLPTGSQVYPHTQPRAGGGGGGSAPTVVFEVGSAGNGFDEFMLSWLRKNVRVKGGGDVQVAFGRRN